MSATDLDKAVREYAGFLLRLHELDPLGDTNLPEQDVICDEMDGPWSRMTGRERKRMKGLSQDLYALAHRRKGVPMNDEEKRRWGQSGLRVLHTADPDVQLEHLRQPFPEQMPEGLIAFLQARAWDRLGDLQVASVFMREAAKTIPLAEVVYLDYLRVLGRTKETQELAERWLESKSDPTALYFASNALFLLAGKMEQSAATANFERIVGPLRKVITEDRKQSPAGARDSLELWAAHTLVFTLLELGKRAEALRVCNETLQRDPDDAGLLIARAMANLSENKKAAETDLERAVRAAGDSGFPYYALAWLRLNDGQYVQVLRLTTQALDLGNISPETRAALYEWRGIAMTMLGQPKEWAEEEFARATSIDLPNTARIEQNKQAAVQAFSASQTGPHRALPIWSTISPGRSVIDHEALQTRKGGMELTTAGGFAAPQFAMLK